MTRPTVETPRGALAPLCVRCGYDLRGLAAEEVCPECGVPIARSRGDEWVRDAPPAYVRALHGGLRLAIAGLSGCLIGVVVGILASILEAFGWSFWAVGAWAAGIVFVLGGVGLSVGWWRLSMRDPRVERGTEQVNARRIVRWTVVSHAALAVCVPVVGTLFWASGAGEEAVVAGSGLIYAAVLVTWIVQFYAGMSYVRWLAPRLPNALVRRRAAVLMWLGPLITVVGWPLLMVGPMLALALYAGILDMLKHDIAAIRRAQRERRR